MCKTYKKPYILLTQGKKTNATDIYRQTDRQTDKQTDRQIDREAGRADRLADRQASRQAGMQADIHGSFKLRGEACKESDFGNTHVQTLKELQR